MINLGSCLIYLLSRNDRVGLQGLGTFRRIDQPGYFDETKQVFVAPVNRIEFVSDDASGPAGSLVIDYIAVQKQIAQEEAARLFQNALEAWTRVLESNGDLKIAGLGTLSKGDVGLEFVPDESGAFGQKLPPVAEIDILSAEEVKDIVQETEVAAVTQEGVVEEEVEEEIEERGGGTWRKIWIAAVFLILAFVSLSYFRPDLIDQGRDYLVDVRQDLPEWLGGKPETPAIDQQQPLQPEPELNTVSLFPDSLETGQDSLALQFPQDSVQLDLVTTASTTGTVETVAEIPKESYEIIVGSFTTMEQAEEFVAEMKANGIEVWAIDSRMPGNRKKVSCASFPTQAEAYRALKEVQRNIEPGAWVAKLVR